jgi:endonuclease-3
LATTYILYVYLCNSRFIKIGKLGKFYFRKGYYVYVGSAKRNLHRRIDRHLRKKKKKFWHIDYFLQYTDIKKVWISDFSEVKTAELLSQIMKIPVLGFGSSDKNSRSHLFYDKTIKNLPKFFSLLTEFKKGL